MATAEHSVGLTGLSDEQREAALAPDGPLLIAAGPGTGKTATVAARIAHLVASGRVAPTAVLALTFTKAAARTLARRLAAGLGPAGSLRGPRRARCLRRVRPGDVTDNPPARYGAGAW